MNLLSKCPACSYFGRRSRTSGFESHEHRIQSAGKVNKITRYSGSLALLCITAGLFFAWKKSAAPKPEHWTGSKLSAAIQPLPTSTPAYREAPGPEDWPQGMRPEPPLPRGAKNPPKNAVDTSSDDKRLIGTSNLVTGGDGVGYRMPLVIDLPKPLSFGMPVENKIPNLEPPRQGKRPEFLAPIGTENLSKGGKVISSDTEPVIGTLDLITDGDKSGDEGCYVELAGGKQWVQIDLGASANIFAVLVWHFHAQNRVYRDVVVQVSDDPQFADGGTTIFNNDTANAFGLGAGNDPSYVETYEGKLMDAKGVQARYVRLYSNGNTSNTLNHYIEVEVFGKPAQ